MSDLEVTVEDGIATLTMNRPEARNAFSLEMREALDQAFHDFEYDDAVRCVVLTGAGEHFMAGGDIKSFHMRHLGDRGVPHQAPRADQIRTGLGASPDGRAIWPAPLSGSIEPTGLFSENHRTNDRARSLAPNPTTTCVRANLSPNR